MQKDSLSIGNIANSTLFMVMFSLSKY